LWGELQREVLDRVGSEDKVIFHRSGFTKSPKSTRLFWTGDQLVSWDSNDGIKAGLVGLLSSGISGFSLNHSDIGGYSGLSLEFMGTQFGHRRSKELLLRWMELAAFGVVFRSHEGTNRIYYF
jgi:sulfoquinovosidase